MPAAVGPVEDGKRAERDQGQHHPDRDGDPFEGRRCGRIAVVDGRVRAQAGNGIGRAGEVGVETGELRALIAVGRLPDERFAFGVGHPDELGPYRLDTWR